MKYYFSFLSLWIANLGVVPLFSFSALRLVPELFFLFLRMIRVFFVLEPMVIFLRCYINYIRPIFLGLCILFVKGNTLAGSAPQDKVYLMSKGEQKEIDLGSSLKRFSVGNNEILRVKVLNAKKILIKAKKLGYSDLKIWHPHGKTYLSFYVLSKFNHLQKHQYMEIIGHFGLTVKPLGKKLLITGELKDLEDYLSLLKIMSKKMSLFIFKVNLSSELKTKLIALIQQELIIKGYLNINCEVKSFQVWCSHQKNSISKEMIKYLSEKYSIKFYNLGVNNLNSNYKMILNLISVESSDGNNWSTGLAPLRAQVGKIIESKNYQDLISDNVLFAESKDFQSKMLVKQEFLFLPDKKIHYEVGSEIPYAQTTNLATNTQWVFAGLKIDLLVKMKDEDFILDYDFSLTKPSENNITGNKESGSIIISKDKVIKAFDVYFENQSNENISLPIINKIPILNKLFNNSQNSNSKKIIIAIIAIKEAE